MDATEKEIKALERKIASVYKDAHEEVSKKWSAYLERMDKKNAPLWDALGKAEDKDEENRIMSQIQANMRKQTLNDNHYKSLVNDISARLANASVIASDYVNGRLPNIYSLNYNDLFKQSELLETGVSFELIDEATVRHLMTTDKSILPTKKVDVPKSTAWNVKQINNQVTQGIIQGENVQKIAKRLQSVTDMNRASSVRNARTMCTEAQNKGRLDSFKEAENEGLIVKKVWMATSDDRTRDWHALLNGEERDVDEPFQTEYGDIMYPGDPTAEPCNVYNCRCTLVSRIVGFKKTTQAEEELEQERVSVDLSNVSILGDEEKQIILDYASDFSSSDISKFNNIFNEAEFIEGDSTYYHKDVDAIFLSPEAVNDYTLYHEGTHYFDYHQNYTITDDWGHFKRVYNDEGDVVGKEWVPDIVTIKDGASFSEFIAWEWDKETAGETSKSTLDMRNLVKKLGTSDTYGPGRAEAVEDVKAINNYLNTKGIRKSDSDYSHLSDFISAMTYDSNLGSLTTGGHSYNYWVQGHDKRVSEITASYNVLRAKGREDLIEIERDLAPNLMSMIEKEWGRIW